MGGLVMGGAFCAEAEDLADVGALGDVARGTRRAVEPGAEVFHGDAVLDGNVYDGDGDSVRAVDKASDIHSLDCAFNGLLVPERHDAEGDGFVEGGGGD